MQSSNVVNAVNLQTSINTVTECHLVYIYARLFQVKSITPHTMNRSIERMYTSALAFHPEESIISDLQKK